MSRIWEIPGSQTGVRGIWPTNARCQPGCERALPGERFPADRLDSLGIGEKKLARPVSLHDEPELEKSEPVTWFVVKRVTRWP